jgi:hypothetical protein
MDCPHLPHSEREGSPIFYRMLRPELLLLRKHQVGGFDSLPGVVLTVAFDRRALRR